MTLWNDSRIRPSVNFHIFRFTLYRSYPIELEVVSMIIDVSPHNRSGPNFSISVQGRCEGGASSNVQIVSQPTILILFTETM